MSELCTAVIISPIYGAADIYGAAYTVAERKIYHITLNVPHFRKKCAVCIIFKFNAVRYQLTEDFQTNIVLTKNVRTEQYLVFLVNYAGQRNSHAKKNRPVRLCFIESKLKVFRNKFIILI